MTSSRRAAGSGSWRSLRAYELQDQGLDTVEANLRRGSKRIAGSSSCPGAILRQMGVESVRLITNNPEKWPRWSQPGFT